MKKDAITVVAALKRAGFRPVVKSSNVSESIYIEVEDIRIRISDHVARPTYELRFGVADVEIGSHEMAGDVGQGLERLIELGFVARDDAQALKEVARCEMGRAERDAHAENVNRMYVASVAANRAWGAEIDAWLDANRPGWREIHGKKRKRLKELASRTIRGLPRVR